MHAACHVDVYLGTRQTSVPCFFSLPDGGLGSLQAPCMMVHVCQSPVAGACWPSGVHAAQVIEDFAADNTIYLELRTTPKVPATMYSTLRRGMALQQPGQPGLRPWTSHSCMASQEALHCYTHVLQCNKSGDHLVLDAGHCLLLCHSLLFSCWPSSLACCSTCKQLSSLSAIKCILFLDLPLLGRMVAPA